MSSEKDFLQVSVQEEGPLERALTVELPAERVDAAFDNAYRSLARGVRVKGFRPGKAPRRVLERLYGGSIEEEVERTLVSASLGEAMQRSDIQPVAQPSVDAPAPEPGTAFRYTARVEIKPRIELPELSGLPANKPSTEVDLAELENELEAIRQGQATFAEEDEDTQAALGHVLQVDFDGTVDGKPFEGGEGRDVDIELGSGRFLPGFEDQLVGSRGGESREVRVTFPEDAGGPLAGQEARFQVRISAVKRRDVPELDDEFAKDVGKFDTLEELRAQVRQKLETARGRAADQALRASVLEALRERTDFVVPSRLVEAQLERRLARARRELESAMPEEELEVQLARWADQWRGMAEQEVREELLLDAVAEARDIEVEETDLDARLKLLAGEEPGELKRLRQAYQEEGLIEPLRAALAREKALEFLTTEARVEETTDS